ncbi:MAG: CBS domain-containing protein [Proteobacteria bacterium]|nr:CBS domain-containing protein [Pseudomonadota bacterium]
MISSTAISLFRASSPFQELDQAALEELVATVSEEFYPRGSTLSDLDSENATAVRIIKKGAAKVTIVFGRNDEALVDYRGEGDIFGYLALLTGDQLRGEIVFLEDTVCYRVERQAVLRLLQRHKTFARQFFVTFLHKYVAKPYRELGKKKLFYGGGDRLLFTTPIGELTTRTLITAPEDISIREATEIMAKNQISSLVLINATGLPAGIITNKDLRDKVVSKGRDTAQPVKKIQSLSLVKAEAGELCIEALFKMIHYNIHHLLVLDNGRLKGIVTTHDLMRLQGASPISIVREIEERHSVEELASPARKIRDLLGHFLQEGVKANHVLRIAAEIGDRLLCKVLEMTQKKAGPSPVPYCFLALGCSGRQEQALPSLQNSAVIYADPANPEQDRVAQEYFHHFTTLAQETLQHMGLPLVHIPDPGNTAIWCQSERSWEKAFSAWILQADAFSVQSSLRFFDFRCLYGEVHMAEKLGDSIRSHLQAGRDFFKTMASTILKTIPPLAGSQHFVAEHTEKPPGPFDYSEKGIKPLVDIVRFLALENGIRETNTLARLRALRTISPLIQQYGRELEYSFDLIFGFWLQHQYDQIRQGFPAHPSFHPERLNSLEQKALQEAFVLIGRIQNLLLTQHYF